MGQVKPSTLNGTPIPGLFEKVRTEGDESRFVSSETGHSQIIHRDDSGRVQAFLSVTPPYYEYTLDFKYLVGKNQLRVAIIDYTTGRTNPLLSLTAIQEARADSGWPVSPTPDLDVNTILHFAEVSDDVVRVYNMGAEKLMVFSVPHTALPAATRSRIIIENQGDGIAEEFLGNGDGILMRSRDGTKGLLTIDDEFNVRVDPR